MHADKNYDTIPKGICKQINQLNKQNKQSHKKNLVIYLLYM